ncbi:uncharacterized protein LOC6586338 [Drosophila mojavensis]|uniref:Coiled-coil domain-containing protein 181 n=1 Tax=Drosophila mojavensis TaxID=7230 RepID=B4L9P1_DROMO|nr:uncharacterized protein LOC6586338 [Drosophila mojavensis]EDW17089.1 uncharacterized protein Dmoj_GI16697 [Drosophila mojavensis]
MYDPEAESDDDCEVYFLKPVNEYNIVDKIKEANKQLFALYEDDDSIGQLSGSIATNRKVTFALNLENYEPVHQQSTQEGQYSPSSEMLQKLAELKLQTERERFAPIEEEPTNELTKMDMEQNAAKPDLEEEICEEILDLTEVENSNSQSKQSAPAALPASMDYGDDDFSDVDEDDLTAATETLARDTQKLRVTRQNTFDLNNEHMEEESDQRSLTNLLTESDCEEDERVVNEARIKLRQAYKSLYKTLDVRGQEQISRLTGTDNVNEDVEEDDLSVIVASYIPEDFELDEHSVYYKKEDGAEQNLSTSTNTKTFFNARRFSFRRRSRATPIAASTVANVPDLKMNYKLCCEHRHALQKEKLPHYTGYMSEYGLSARQLQQREQQLRRKQRNAIEQTLNRNEHELKKMQDNERAFTTWLKNKMRYPINKTRNMFDATRRRGTVAAVTSPNAHPKREPEQELRSSRRRDSHEVHAYRHLLGSWNK